jgi:hypothetical protein
LIGVVAFGSFAWLCQADRFAVDQQRFLAGESIGRHTQPGDLVLSLTKGRTTGWSDPRILYFAKRRGWASNFDQLDEKSLDLYRDHGAAYGAVLVTPLYWPLEEEDYGVLSIFPKKEYPLSDDAGNLLGYLVLVDLENAKLGPANNE